MTKDHAPHPDRERLAKRFVQLCGMLAVLWAVSIFAFVEGLTHTQHSRDLRFLRELDVLEKAYSPEAVQTGSAGRIGRVWLSKNHHDIYEANKEVREKIQVWLNQFSTKVEKQYEALSLEAPELVGAVSHQFSPQEKDLLTDGNPIQWSGREELFEAAMDEISERPSSGSIYGAANGALSVPTVKPINRPKYKTGIPVPGQPNFNYSPFTNKMLSVEGLPDGTLVRDPHDSKNRIFLVYGSEYNGDPEGESPLENQKDFPVVEVGPVKEQNNEHLSSKPSSSLNKDQIESPVPLKSNPQVATKKETQVLQWKRGSAPSHLSLENDEFSYYGEDGEVGNNETVNDYIQRLRLLKKPRPIFVATAIKGELKAGFPEPMDHPRPYHLDQQVLDDIWVKREKFDSLLGYWLVPKTTDNDGVKNWSIEVVFAGKEYDTLTEKGKKLRNKRAMEGKYLHIPATNQNAYYWIYHTESISVEVKEASEVSAIEWHGLSSGSLEEFSDDHRLIERVSAIYGNLTLSEATDVASNRSLQSLERVSILGFSIGRNQFPIAVLIFSLVILGGIAVTAHQSKKERIEIIEGVSTDSAFELLVDNRYTRFFTLLILPTMTVILALPRGQLMTGEISILTIGSISLLAMGGYAFWNCERQVESSRSPDL